MYLAHLESTELKKAFVSQVAMIGLVSQSLFSESDYRQVNSILQAIKHFGDYRQVNPTIPHIPKDSMDKFAKELQLTLEDIQAQHKAVEKYLEYLKTASDDAESPILQRERVWSEFAKVLESASNPIKKIVYFETYTLIATINRSYENKPDSTKADNTRALEEYCEFLRQKLGISPDIARRLEDIVQFDLDSYKHITDTITLH